MKERLSEFLKPRAYSAIGLDFLDKPLCQFAWLANVNTTYIVTHNLRHFSNRGIEEQFGITPISPQNFLFFIKERER